MNPELGFSEVLRDVAQLGSALRSGRRGRRFKSCHPDQNEKDRVRDTVLFVFRKGMTDLNPWARASERMSGGHSNRPRSEAGEEDRRGGSPEPGGQSCHPDQNEKDRVRDTVLFVFRKGMTDLNLPYFSFTTPAQKQAIISTKSI